jgi:hypothetical protein
MNSRNSAKESKAGMLDRRALRLTLLVALSIVLTAILAYAGGEEPAAPVVNAQQSSTPADWKAVEQALGKAGAMQPGDVFKAGLPRTDLNVTVRGVQVKPALALGSWVAFKKMGSEAMVMGDLVLTEDEVSPVMMKLQQGGIEQTALHNHVLGEAPRVMYMHILGHGDPVKMAHAIHDALALSKTPFAAPAPAAPSLDIGIDTKQINEIMGYSGKVNGGVYQFAIPRSEKITDGGMEVPPAMGTAIAINFQPTGGGKAAITGDYTSL